MMARIIAMAALLCLACPLGAVPAEAVLNVVDTNRAAVLARDYFNNKLNIVDMPSGRYDLEQLPANMPYQFVVAGGCEDVAAMAEIVASVTNAMPKDVYRHCVGRKVLCPVLQWLLRRNSNLCESEQDYLSYKAHPWAFKASDFSKEKLACAASKLTIENLPPVIKVKPIFAEYARHPYRPAVPLLDYPDTHPEIGINELMGVSVVLRAPEAKRVFRFYAKPFNAEPIQYEYRWVFICRKKYSTYVKNNYLGGYYDGYRSEFGCAEMIIDWREVASRVDLAVFARKHDGPFGPPAIISFYRLPTEQRSYRANGDIDCIQYKRSSGGSFDFLEWIYDTKDWRDYYVLDAEHDIFSISRCRNSMLMTDKFFYPTGERILSTFPNDTPEESIPVAYVKENGMLSYRDKGKVKKYVMKTFEPRTRGDFRSYVGPPDKPRDNIRRR